MIKKILLAMLMASLMFSVQISMIGCEDNNDAGPDVSGSADQFASSNDYKVNARIVGVFSFGGLSTCADIEITKDGTIIEDALVLVNSDTIPYSYGLYQTSLTTSNNYELTITHDGNLIASGEGVKSPGAIPTITNLDSGDVHLKNSDLTVEWNSVSDVTSWQVVSSVSGSQTYESALLPLDARSHVIPGTNFSPGNYDVQVNAINGLYPGDDGALSDPQVGYDIDGPKGYFIGLTQSNTVEILVNE
tara:strand:- start:208 stop:948 length:741 start_codon:yes stop_codon:yes gene_type:complete